MCYSHNGFQLSPEGLAQRELEFAGFPEVGLTRSEESVTLDSRVSVSGLRRDEIAMEFHEEIIDEQYRRFLELEPDEGGCI